MNGEKYLHSSGWYSDIWSRGSMKVLEWDKHLQKYRCDLKGDNFGYISYYSEKELDDHYQVYVRSTLPKCTCGSDSVLHPGHSYYCDKGRAMK